MERWKEVPLGEMTISDIVEIFDVAKKKIIEIAKTKKTMEEINLEIEEEIERIKEIIDRFEEASSDTEIIFFPTKN